MNIHAVKNGFTWNVSKWNFPKCPAEGNYSRLDRLVVLPFQAGAQCSHPTFWGFQGKNVKASKHSQMVIFGGNNWDLASKLFDSEAMAH